MFITKTQRRKINKRAGYFPWLLLFVEEFTRTIVLLLYYCTAVLLPVAAFHVFHVRAENTTQRCERIMSPLSIYLSSYSRKYYCCNYNLRTHKWPTPNLEDSFYSMEKA